VNKDALELVHCLRFAETFAASRIIVSPLPLPRTGSQPVETALPKLVPERLEACRFAPRVARDSRKGAASGPERRTTPVLNEIE